MPTQPEKVYRLNDLEVQEVSLVDAPANQRKFLVVKNAEVGKTSDAVDDVMADKSDAETHLFSKLHPDVQVKAGDLLTKAGERLLALAGAVKAAKAETDADPGVPAKLSEEIVSVLTALGSFAPEAVQAAATMADPDKEKDKAARGKPGDKKKGLEQIAAAIEVELSKADMSDEMLSVLYLTAGKEALRMAQDACYDNDYDDAAKYAHMAYMYLAKYGLGMGSPMQMSTDLEELARKLAPITKAGRKMSAARWEELDKSLRALLALAEEVQPGYLENLTGPGSGVAKADVDRLVKMLREKNDTIKSLRAGHRPASNSLPTGEGLGDARKPCTWPSDMNADYNDFDEADQFQ